MITGAHFGIRATTRNAQATIAELQSVHACFFLISEVFEESAGRPTVV